jgi:hypothetical protein
MDTYRFKSGQVTGPVDIAECENDDAAIHHARNMQTVMRSRFGKAIGASA